MNQLAIFTKPSKTGAIIVPQEADRNCKMMYCLSYQTHFCWHSYVRSLLPETSECSAPVSASGWYSSGGWFGLTLGPFSTQIQEHCSHRHGPGNLKTLYILFLFQQCRCIDCAALYTRVSLYLCAYSAMTSVVTRSQLIISYKCHPLLYIM